MYFIITLILFFFLETKVVFNYSLIAYFERIVIKNAERGNIGVRVLLKIKDRGFTLEYLKYALI